MTGPGAKRPARRRDRFRRDAVTRPGVRSWLLLPQSSDALDTTRPLAQRADRRSASKHADYCSRARAGVHLEAGNAVEFEQFRPRSSQRRHCWSHEDRAIWPARLWPGQTSACGVRPPEAAPVIRLPRRRLSRSGARHGLRSTHAAGTPGEEPASVGLTVAGHPGPCLCALGVRCTREALLRLVQPGGDGAARADACSATGVVAPCACWTRAHRATASAPPSSAHPKRRSQVEDLTRCAASRPARQRRP